MLDWFLETGIYLLGIAVMPGAGLLLICWGLWGDRSKGRTSTWPGSACLKASIRNGRSSGNINWATRAVVLPLNGP